MSEIRRDGEERDAEALRWIIRILEELEVAHQVVGGLAARAHGATRPLADLDLYIEGGRLDEVVDAVRPWITRPPGRHRDDDWDLVFMQVEYAGRKVELGVAEGARYRDRRRGEWRSAGIDFEAGEVREVLGVEVPVMPLERLLDYKEALGREVDRRDVAEIGRGEAGEAARQEGACDDRAKRGRVG